MRLLHGSNLDVLPTIDSDSIDAIVTDPPYELGFMGKKWDASGIAYNVDLWRECLRVLKPGGHLLAFGGTRTYHRMTCAIENAGFEIRDCIQWIYGSGFPKSHNVANAIDKKMGMPNRGKAIPVASSFQASDTEQVNKLVSNEVAPYEARTEQGKAWQGWGTALKPAHEDIIMATKPIEYSAEKYIITVCQNILASTVKTIITSSRQEQKEAQNIAHKLVGANISTLEDLSAAMDTLQFESTENTYLNIGISWLTILAEIWRKMSMSTTSTKLSMITELKILKSLVSGSIFQNTIHQKKMNQDGINANVYNVDTFLNAVYMKLSYILEHFAVDNATSKVKEGGLRPNNEPIVMARKPLIGAVADNVLTHGTGGLNIDSGRIYCNEDTRRDTGGSGMWGNAGRVIGGSKSGRWPANVILDEEAGKILDEQARDEVSRFFYCPKPNKKERNAGLESRQVQKVSDGREKEADNYLFAYQRGATERLNIHPTIKPVSLMSHLIKLVTPIGGIVLDPFMGSGTTGIAAVINDYDFIGIEQSAEYIEIAESRIKHYAEQPKQMGLL